jgi:hypothetical protein
VSIEWTITGIVVNRTQCACGGSDSCPSTLSWKGSASSIASSILRCIFAFQWPTLATTARWRWSFACLCFFSAFSACNPSALFPLAIIRGQEGPLRAVCFSSSPSPDWELCFRPTLYIPHFAIACVTCPSTANARNHAFLSVSFAPPTTTPKF